MSIEQLNKKASLLPELPGCYLMLNDKADVIYIGKAKNLKNRVSSYFLNSKKNPKTELLVSNIEDFEFKLAASETEALILENNLIKKFRPKYNILLRDDKSYPFLAIDWSHPAPQIEYTRRVKRNKKTELFGPFVHGSNVSEVITIIRKQLQLRMCNDLEFSRRKRACILHQMQQCSGPCVGLIANQDYLNLIKLVVDFFSGDPQKLINHITDKMQVAATQEQFELAAQIRDNLEVVKRFVDERFNNVKIFKESDCFDVIGIFQSENYFDISIYMVRNGLELGHKNFHFAISDCQESPFDELEKLLFRYYLDLYETKKIKIYFESSIIGITSLKEAFNIAAVEDRLEVLNLPSAKKHIYQLACENAKESQRVRLEQGYGNLKALESLQKLLKLKERPIVLECFDIAIWQGDSPTGSQVVFYNGAPDKAAYRHYNLTKLPEGNNDFAMMSELITRRLKHGKMPDVMVVDGGKGQLNIFNEVLKSCGIEVPIIGIAKEKAGRDNIKKEERLYFVGRKNPFILSKDKNLLKLIVFIRNEAHRFSRRLHHKRERERIFNSNSS